MPGARCCIASQLLSPTARLPTSGLYASGLVRRYRWPPRWNFWERKTQPQVQEEKRKKGWRVRRDHRWIRCILWLYSGNYFEANEAARKVPKGLLTWDASFCIDTENIPKCLQITPGMHLAKNSNPRIANRPLIARKEIRPYALQTCCSYFGARFEPTSRTIYSPTRVLCLCKAFQLTPNLSERECANYTLASEWNKSMNVSRVSEGTIAGGGLVERKQRVAWPLHGCGNKL